MESTQAQQIRYTFNPEMFNDLFWRLRKATTRWVVSYGGAGSGKSYTQAQHEVIKALESKQKILIIRKVAATLKDSVIPLIVEHIIPGWGALAKDWSFNKSDRILTNKRNGSQIIFRGMDDPEKIKSIQGVTRVWYEEVTEGDEQDVDQLNIRLRGEKNLQITLTFNPIDELHWLKKKFFDNGVENCTVLHTTYLDNKFIDDEFIKTIEGYRLTDPNFYAVYGLGAWGKLTKGGEFYKQFKYEHRVIKQVPRDEGAPLHITFDENVNPWVTLNIWQAKEKRAWQIGEIALEDPRNTLGETLREFLKYYPPNKARVFLYGDASSRKQDAKLEKGIDFYVLIEKFLTEHKYSWERRVPLSNPSVELRGQFINDVFENKFDDCEIYFCENCKKTIADYQYLKQHSDGGKLKENAKNPTTKVVFQKWGHATDANDYFICEYFAGSYAKFSEPESAKRFIQRRKLSGRY